MTVRRALIQNLKEQGYKRKFHYVPLSQPLRQWGEIWTFLRRGRGPIRRGSGTADAAAYVFITWSTDEAAVVVEAIRNFFWQTDKGVRCMGASGELFKRNTAVQYILHPPVLQVCMIKVNRSRAFFINAIRGLQLCAYR